jgi:NADH-quinone oxidoreductase subunit J
LIDTIVFVLAAAIVLVGAVGVVFRTNPVHCALHLIMTLFGVAVLFVSLEANFLAVVQVIVYAGAVVVLYLFVIMLIGVDQAESLTVEPLKGQRILAAVFGVGVLALVLISLIGGSRVITGQPSVSGALSDSDPDINQLARNLFSDYVFAFEVTSVLLVIAVVGTVILARRPTRPLGADPQAEHEAELRETP